MLYRAACYLPIPLATAIACWILAPVVNQAAPAAAPLSASALAAVSEAPAPPAPREVSRILAVDSRIASRVNQLRPCVKQRLARVVEKLPKNVTLLVTSASRTREEQEALRPTFGIKARPGTSTHEDGRAVDLNVYVDGERVRPRYQDEIIGPAMASEGFRYLGPRDPVHYSIPKEKIDTALSFAPDLPVMTMDEALEIKTQTEMAGQAALVDAASAQ